MPKKSEEAPKLWVKASVKPETGKALKKIAVDQDKYVYQLIEDVFREKYPEYFNSKSKNNKLTV